VAQDHIKKEKRKKKKEKTNLAGDPLQNKNA
jgi:hypothetical protein